MFYWTIKGKIIFIASKGPDFGKIPLKDLALEM
jgi:hypothetical protein